MTPSPALLITGFEPFGGQPHNSSQLLVEALDRRRSEWLEGRSAVLSCLPTSFHRAKRKLTALLEQHQPGFALHLGLARSARQLRFETVATNLDDSNAVDNDGECRQGQPITAGAPPRWSTGVEPNSLLVEARRFGQGLDRSEDCGGFVCNHVYYHSCQYFYGGLPKGQCVFVHVPPMQPGDNQLAVGVQIIANWLKTVQTQLP